MIEAWSNAMKCQTKLYNFISSVLRSEKKVVLLIHQLASDHKRIRIGVLYYISGTWMAPLHVSNPSSILWSEINPCDHFVNFVSSLLLLKIMISLPHNNPSRLVKHNPTVWECYTICGFSEHNERGHGHGYSEAYCIYIRCHRLHHIKNRNSWD